MQEMCVIFGALSVAYQQYLLLFQDQSFRRLLAVEKDITSKYYNTLLTISHSNTYDATHMFGATTNVGLARPDKLLPSCRNGCERS